MKTKELTDAELLVLGLVSEMPRHGYELEQVIEQRGMREWTHIGFSSIYFVLGKLEKMSLVAAGKPPGPKARKIYAVTERGLEALTARSLAALGSVRPTYSSVLMGMLHWPLLKRKDALKALRERAGAVAAEIDRLKTIRLDQQPLPDFIEALFEFSLDQLNAEAAWIARTSDYMEHKP